MATSMLINQLGTVVTAIGGLGVAAFGLVDATKIGRNGGVSNSGFSSIEAAVKEFFPGAKRAFRSPASPASSATSHSSDAGKLLDILHGQWINGTALDDQRAIAKSLIKLRLTPQTAANFAQASSVDPNLLSEVATGMTTGASLTPAQINVLGRFDLALTAILDEGYQRADQKYRNQAKVLASVVAVVLAVFGGWALFDTSDTITTYFFSRAMWQSVLCGLLAIPIAPISKDLTTALAAGAQLAQSLRK